MLKTMPREVFLAELKAETDRHRQIVEAEFLPLGREARSWRPAPQELSVDQCFQHLITAFEYFAPNLTAALKKPAPAGRDGVFRPTLWARWTFPLMLDPARKAPTLPIFKPAAAYHPDVFTGFQAQLDRLEVMLDQAAGADLQAMCWYFKKYLVRYNLGEYLRNFVLHHDLHIGQAQRVLAAYATQAAAAGRLAHPREPSKIDMASSLAYSIFTSLRQIDRMPLRSFFCPDSNASNQPIASFLSATQSNSGG